MKYQMIALLLILGLLSIAGGYYWINRNTTTNSGENAPVDFQKIVSSADESVLEDTPNKTVYLEQYLLALEKKRQELFDQKSHDIPENIALFSHVNEKIDQLPIKDPTLLRTIFEQRLNNPTYQDFAIKLSKKTDFNLDIQPWSMEEYLYSALKKWQPWVASEFRDKPIGNEWMLFLVIRLGMMQEKTGLTDAWETLRNYQPKSHFAHLDMIALQGMNDAQSNTKRIFSEWIEIVFGRLSEALIMKFNAYDSFVESHPELSDFHTESKKFLSSLNRINTKDFDVHYKDLSMIIEKFELKPVEGYTPVRYLYYMQAFLYSGMNPRYPTLALEKVSKGELSIAKLKDGSPVRLSQYFPMANTFRALIMFRSKLDNNTKDSFSRIYPTDPLSNLALYYEKFMIGYLYSKETGKDRFIAPPYIITSKKFIKIAPPPNPKTPEEYAKYRGFSSSYSWTTATWSTQPK